MQTKEDTGKADSRETGERVPSTTSPVQTTPKTPKAKKGKPVTTAGDQARIIRRQQRDCKRLAGILAEVGERANYGASEGQSVAAATRALVASTKDLHAMEREAFDMGQRGHSIRAIIVIPQAPGDGSVEAWAAAAAGVLPNASVDRSAAAVTRSLPLSLEDDVQGVPDGRPASEQEVYPDE